MSKFCLHCSKEFFKIKNESVKAWNTRHKFCSKSCHDDYRKNKPTWNKGLKGVMKPNSGSFQKGNSNRNWNGGVSPINRLIRGSREYRIWMNAVRERDNHKCIWCGETKNLQTDHIKPFALYPELRFAIDNGRTLCKECHKTTDTFGYRSVYRQHSF